MELLSDIEAPCAYHLLIRQHDYGIHKSTTTSFRNVAHWACNAFKYQGHDSFRNFKTGEDYLPCMYCLERSATCTCTASHVASIVQAAHEAYTGSLPIEYYFSTIPIKQTIDIHKIPRLSIPDNVVVHSTPYIGNRGPSGHVATRCRSGIDSALDVQPIRHFDAAKVPKPLRRTLESVRKRFHADYSTAPKEELFQRLLDTMLNTQFAVPLRLTANDDCEYGRLLSFRTTVYGSQALSLCSHTRMVNRLTLKRNVSLAIGERTISDIMTLFQIITEEGVIHHNLYSEVLGAGFLIMIALGCDTDEKSHDHEGLLRGAKISHVHLCEKCGHKYIHTHIIKGVIESVTFGQTCRGCSGTWDAKADRLFSNA